MKMLHEKELINIEEDINLQPGDLIRRFTLHNRINGLRVCIVNTGAAVLNINLNDKHDIVRLSSGNKLLDWNPHVLGLDTLILNIYTTTLMYQLTENNELIVIGKFRKTQQHMDIVAKFFFNLNPESKNLDGHLLHVKSISTDYEADQEPVLCSTNPQSFNLTGPDPFKLEACDYLFDNHYDNVFTATGDKSTLLIVTLSYGSKCVEVTIKSNSPSAISMGNGKSTPVTCRVRIRIRPNGICIMPYMMTEFHCVYKFIW